jgi:glutamine amidotransferase
MAHRLNLEAAVWRRGPLPPDIDWILLPGVGSMQTAMHELAARELLNPLEEAHRQQMPILGICLGLQLFFETGDEGGRGLGWIRGTVPRLQAKRTPHMGWNTVHPRFESPLLAEKRNDVDAAFYFVHSYAVKPEDPQVILAETTYAGETFASIVQESGLVGVQFHPELSGARGREFIQAFVKTVTS